MNKAAIASLLVLSAFVPASRAFAQAPAGQVVMDHPEVDDYNAAMGQTTPAAQAPALEAYLAKYPKSQVKNDTLQRIMLDYSQVDLAKAAAAADNYLQVNPTNLQAFIIEVTYHTQKAQAAGVDPATKQAELDAAASFAQKGLDAAKAPKPADLTDAQFSGLKAFAVPTFYSTIGQDDLNKKDGAGAVAAFTAEIAALPPFNAADLTGSDPAKKQAALANLQETYYLGNAYYVSNPPDYLDCAFYATRAASLAPDQFKPQLQPLATYCYKKYHGGADGSDALVALVKTTATAPPDLNKTITPAPTPADIVHGIMYPAPPAPPTDLAALALSDKEFILQYGEKADAEKVFDTIKGKSVQIPGAVVIESSPTVLKVAVSDDAVQGKTPDFTFNMKPLEAPEEPKAKTPAALAAYKRAKTAYDKQVADIAAATAVGQKVDLQGTYDSYTSSPIMIIMNDGEVVLPKPEPKKPATPAHRVPAHK